jgi:ribose-phosphate pyrophosphokinase
MPGNETLARGLAHALGLVPSVLSVHRFPDGESLVRVDSDVADRDVALVCTLRGPDALFLPLAFASQALRDGGARSVGLVAPYLAYMRQDRRFHPGEALTSVRFATLLGEVFDWLVTIDPHLHRYKTLADLYRIPATALHAGPLLAEFVRGVDRPLLIGPDVESEQWVADVARQVDAPFLVLEKTRLGDRDVRIRVPALTTHADRTPVLVDDIISSARTMLTALRGWPAGARRPVCLGIHAVFAAGAHDELAAAAPAAIATTNTIPHPTNRIDVVPLLQAEVALRLERGTRDGG